MFAGPAQEAGRMLLTKHENTTFTNQTIYISGQAFIRCGFVACTLVLRGETVYHLEECTFDRCNWHLDCVMLWGSAESVRQVKAIVGLLEQGLQNIQDQEAAAAGGGGGAGGTAGTANVEGGGPSPFAT
jgi:hypothetical protein